MGVWNYIIFLICLVSLFSTAAAQSAPRNVFFQYHPLNELTVSWTPPVNLDGITGYSLVYTANGNQKEVTIDGPGATTTTVQDNDLAGNPPLIVLLAPMMNGNIDGANIVRATTPTEQDQVLPPAPPDATVQRTSINSYQLTWANTNGNSPVAIEGYVISYAQTSSTGTDMSSIEVPPDRNAEQIQDLQPNTDYTFYLYSQNNGLRSRANLTTLPPVTQDLKPPENFIIYQLSLSSILLRWDPPAPPDNSFEDYVVVYLNNDNGQVLEEIQLDSTITSYVVSNLQGDISYIFRVVTQAGTARSESNEFIAKPLDPFANIQLMVGAVTDQKIQLSWQNPNLNRNFVVHLFKDDGTQEINQTVPNLPSITTVIQDLMSDSTYVIVVEDSLTLTVLGSVQAMTNTPPNSVVTVNSKTASSVTLSWIGFTSATSYRISYISQDNTGTGVLSSTTPISVVTGLQPQMTYTFSVVATVGTSEINVGSVTETTDTVSTMAVNATPGTNTIDLSWASIPDTVLYQIVYQPLVPGGMANQRNSFQNFFTLTDLLPVTTYNITVYAFTSSLGTSALVTVGSVITSTVTENFILYQLSVSSILLRWDPPSPPDNSFANYVVIYFDSANGEVPLEIQLDSTVTSHVLSNLRGDASYIFQVVTQAGNARSESNPFIGKALDLSANIQLMVGAVTDQKVELSWQNSDLNRNFVVHLFKDDGTQEINQTVLNPPSITTVIQDLMSDSTYVIVVEDVLTFSVLGVVQAMTNTPPNSVVTVNSKTASSVTLSWIGFTSATSYRISYISQDNTGTGVLSSTTPTSVVTGLRPQMTYTFSVVATVFTSEINVGSVTETTDTVSTMAVNATPGTNTIDLSWASIPDTVLYQIVYQPLVPGGMANQRNSFQNFFTLTDLLPVTTYNITVYAFTSSLGMSALVTVGSVITSTVTVLKPPENFILYQLSVSSILLRWDPPSPPDNSFGNYVVIYFDSANGEAPQEIQLDSTVTSHVLSNLRGDASYIFQVVTQAGTVRSENNPFIGKALGNYKT
nr:tenascin-R-like [Lytechinus pictus]